MHMLTNISIDCQAICCIFQHDWTFNLGEPAMDMSVTNFANAPPSIIVLGKDSNNEL